jgi:Rha family phage regulatory protein
VVYQKRGERRDVAAFFGKRHDHVLRDIREIIANTPKTPIPNFGEGCFTLPSTGSQAHPCFTMTRDGFSLLAMGFTGTKALGNRIEPTNRGMGSSYGASKRPPTGAKPTFISRRQKRN